MSPRVPSSVSSPQRAVRAKLDRRRALSWQRYLLLSLALSTCSLRAGSARAQEVLHYEPPGVDYIYPLGEEPETDHDVDAGGPERDEDAASSGAATDAGVSAAAQSADAATPATAADSGPAGAWRVDLPDAGLAEETEYGARAAVARPASEGTHRITLQSARDLPGAFGDPLRILDALPGVVPIASGVPYVYVRGAPPASTGYVYDDIPLPALYHVGFGPAVIHPRTTGAVTLTAGVPRARYGRRAGGLLLAEGTDYQRDFDAEVEVRLLDIGGFMQGKLGKGLYTVSGRVGYPLAVLVARAIGVLDPGTKINYMDGQFRYKYPLSQRDHAEFVYLGSYDNIKLPGVSNVPGAGATAIQFQRLESRFVHRIKDGEFGAALRYGYDRSALGSALKVRGSTLGPRFWSEWRKQRNRLRIGGDLYVTIGSVHNGTGSLASPEGDLKVRLPTITGAPARNQGGLYVDSSLYLSERVHLELGLRFDYWSVQSRLSFGVDPRVRAIYDLTDKLTVHAAFGLAHQPAVFFLPLPGLTDVALDRGLTRTLQSEVGVSYQLPYKVRLEVQGYLHHYTGLLLPELVMDGSISDKPPLSNALAYGMEVFLKRELADDLTGWVSYTLGWAQADAYRSIGKFKPDFDVRHVLNVVLQWRVYGGWAVGGRLQARSGRVIDQLNPRYEQRLPWFVRPDLRVGYSWRGRYGDMTAYLEWLNAAGQGEYLDADCLLGKCKATQAPPISLGNLGVRADF
ncbi:MAG: TonB family protein / TonB-dependent receptor [Myxococcaceae bacterium]|nr:TonB family protein / TonB-dependent receptor [Myxococcaceae bacterium]